MSISSCPESGSEMDMEMLILYQGFTPLQSPIIECGHLRFRRLTQGLIHLALHLGGQRRAPL
jgi:hypothetical protein